ncbi:MAG: GNAT family N-acetyltransferase [Pseudomonadota bacterium]
MSLVVRPAIAEDAATIHRFVLDLAIHHEHHEVQTTLAEIEQALFGPTPHAFCDIAELDGEILGIATWFYTWSSWTGRRGLYLEDLFVTDAARGTGAGRALMAALAQRCAAEGLPRIEWAVQGDNEGGQAFYSRLGAAPQEHAIWRLSGQALADLAEEAR